MLHRAKESGDNAPAAGFLFLLPFIAATTTLGLPSSFCLLCLLFLFLPTGLTVCRASFHTHAHDSFPCITTTTTAASRSYLWTARALGGNDSAAAGGGVAGR